jgi:transcriptional regulator with XRE-family HTH domain
MVYRIRWTKEQRDRFVGRWMRFRTRYGLTQVALAEAMGVHVNTVYRVERGRYVPNNDTVMRFEAVEKRYKVGETAGRELAFVPGESDGI